VVSVIDSIESNVAPTIGDHVSSCEKCYVISITRFTWFKKKKKKFFFFASLAANKDKVYHLTFQDNFYLPEDSCIH
jgi:hypothetical protein